MRVLALTLHRKDRSPGQRYRIEQYLSYLDQHNVTIHFSPLLKTKLEDDTFYQSRSFLAKSFIGLKALLRRIVDVLKARRYDCIFVFRDAFFFGTFFEKWMKRRNIKIIYDFDDAIWLLDKNPNQGIFNKLKNPQKAAIICELADQIIVGNEYLRNYALQFNPVVHIIPSTIDLDVYNSPQKEKKKICIGWTGSFSTIKHFEIIIPSLLSIREKYKDHVYFKLIGDPTYQNEPLSIKGIKWVSETEAQDLSELDIGLMPLPDNEWTRGKCGMKGLQYMALEIPTIMSPVGVNSDIIQDGENGFLASSTEEWVEKISLLIEDDNLREKLGKTGRNTVEKYYSVEANKEKWLQAFQF